MPPRGHHGYELPASQTDRHGNRVGTHYEAPGSTGFGLTPGNVDGYYNNPDGSPKMPGNQFSDAWNRAGGGRDAQIALQQQQQKAYDDHIAQLRLQATAIAKKYNDRAKLLRDAANGKKGLDQFALDRVTSYYGLDLSTAKGRLAAHQWAQHLSELAMNSVSDQGVQELTGFDTNIKTAIQQNRHKQFVKEQLDLKNQIDSTPQGGSLLTDAYHTIKGDRGYPSTFAEGAQNLLDRGLAGLGIESQVFTPLNNAWRAFEYSRLKGNDPWTSIHAGVAALPGLGFTAGGGSVARQAVEATNTSGEAEQLTKEGKLRSIGQALTGNTDGLKGIALKNAQGMNEALFGKKNPTTADDILSFSIDGHKVNIISGSLDAAFQIGQDPTLYAGHVLGGFREVGASIEQTVKEGIARAEASVGTKATPEAVEAVTRAARTNFIRTSKIGSAVLDETLTALERMGPSNVESIMKALGGKNVSREVGQAIYEAGSKNGPMGIRAELVDQFAKGTWHPQRSVFERVNVALGISNVPRWSSPPIGDLLRSVVNRKKLSEDVVDAAGNVIAAAGSRAHTAPLRATGNDAVDKALTWSIEHAAFANKEWGGSILERFTNEVPMDMATRTHMLASAADATGTPAFQHMVDVITAPLNTKLFSELSREEQVHLLDNVRKAEAVASILQGAAGPEARQRVFDQLSRQTSLAKTDVAINTVSKVVADIKGLEWSPASYRKVEPAVAQLVVQDLPESTLRDQLTKELGEAEVGSDKYGRVVQSIDLVVSNPQARDEATRAMELWGDRVSIQESLSSARLLDSSSMLGNVLSGGSKILLSLAEKAPGTVLRTLASPFIGENQRAIAQFMDRYAGAIGLGLRERQAIAAEAERVAEAVARGGAPNAAYEFHSRLIELAFEKNGLSKENAREWASAYADKFAGTTKTQEAFGLANAGDLASGGDPLLNANELELLNRPQVISQAKTTFNVPDVETLTEGIRKTLSDVDKGSAWNSVRVGWDEAKNHVWFKLAGHPVTILGSFQVAMKFWKVMVTTRMYLPILAIGANYKMTGDIWSSLAVGGIAGGFGFVRYRARLSFQNRLDAVLEHGFTPAEWIPGYGRVVQHVDRPIYGAGANSLFPDPEVAAWVEGRVGNYTRSTEGLWEVISPNGGKKALDDFIEGIHRVINFQVNPETDEVMRLMLEEKAGSLTKEQAAAKIEDFLAGRGDYEGLQDGKNWLEKARGLEAGTSNKKALDKYQRFVDTYITSPDLARLRLDPSIGFGPGLEIQHDQLRDLLDKGLLPDAVHFQRGESLLKDGPGGVFKVWRNAYQAAAYDSARSASFRETFFAQERRIQESQLRAAGVPVERARELAGELATRRTNDLMFRYDNVSRFAHKVDFIAPFTGHRLFNIQTWTKLALEHPGRALRIQAHAAQAFNVGKENGFFHQDPYGTWQMTIPGSTWISQAFGLGPVPFDVPLTGFFALSGELSRGLDHFSPIGAALDAVLPHPGGLWWAAAGATIRELDPDLLDPKKSFLPKELRNFLYPYGPSNGLLTPEASRYLRVMVGTKGPWSLLDDDQGTEELNKWEVRSAKDLVAEHRREFPGDLTWFPSDAEVKQRTMALFNTWSFLTTTSPAAPHPRFHNEDKFNELWKAWLGPLAGKKLDSDTYSQMRKSFVNRFPAYAPFLDASGKWIGDSHNDWVHSTDQKSQEDYQIATFMKRRKQLSLREYRTEFNKFRQDEAASKAFHDAMEAPNPREREQLLQKYRHDFPEQAANYRLRVHAEADLARIMQEYPKGEREAAIERWRHDWAQKGQTTVSRREYERLLARVRDNKQQNGGQYHLSPWKRSRETEDLWKDFRKSTGFKGKYVMADGTVNPKLVWFAGSLVNPAEQVKVWQEAAARLSEDWQFAETDPAKFLDAYSAIKKKISDVYNLHGDELRSAATRAPNDSQTYATILKQHNTDEATTLNGMYAKAAMLKAAVDRAYATKQYATGRALREQRDAVFEQIRQFKNDQWANRPESQEMHDAVREVTYFNSIDAPASVIAEAWKRVQAASKQPLAPTNEEAHFLSLPPAAKEAYVNELVHQLNVPAGEGTDRFNLNAVEAMLGRGTKTLDYKVYWSYLTDFQRSLLEKHMPKPTVDGWAGLDKATEEKKAKAAAGGSGGRGRGGGSDLSWAYAQMKQYSKRGGMAKPASYDEYLALPNNPAARNDFLEKHPDVAAYVKAGPMANMPPVIQMMVQNIMIQAGKWDGEVRDIHELTDIAFAREQLQRYNMRTGPAPQTYDLWLNMPSGQEKADYLTAHPEIKAWLQLGPMANMPEVYRDVVRDIMYRYHEWTASTDGMGDTLSGYYRTPSYARNAYLAEHPELAAYWAATRSPADEAMGQLVDAYYGTPDPGSKAAMLSAHPELKQYFLDARSRRYERFLNQVAQYMGANPTLFQSYLDNQQRVLGDLLNKFAEPNLAREEHWLKPTKANTKGSEGGRKRQ